ncbi:MULTISPECIES: ABC transporter permease [Amycolatopsis]|uniref:Peptide/nickel transport system permease protein n=2 Tax=Amycolatopsis TaxID=1813 RepID=A0A1I3U3G7_9PSEU|nr:ABC transporter permease [Amycolatopsis sacchari]SFJ77540.1 peptide/nickel transport system permease protein [Amycolatopsis sacchari]
MTTNLLRRKRDRIDDLAETSGGTSLAADAFKRMSRSPIAITGAVITILFVLLAVLSPFLAPKDPHRPYDELKATLRPDSIPGAMPGFLLGSDQNGYDFFSRLLVGSQQTLIVGVVATLIGVAIGMVIGGLAGALGGWVDTVLMRFTDILLAIPSLLLAISIAALFPGTQWTVIIAVAVVSVPVFARLLRGAMLAQRSSDHVLAATALGVRRSTIVFRHMLPNSVGPVIVQATLTLATSIIDAAALSFLGLGDADWTRAEWGLMLGKAQDYLDVKPELAFYPAIAIIIVALGFTLLGESLREALDPKNRR